MTTEAYAKVNFTLEVLGKRVDGYHALRSVVVPISLSDTLELAPAAPGVVESDTGYHDDLCVMAARALGCDGVGIHVEKRVPVGGGLGGGSADAAAVLWALNESCGLGLSPQELAAVGARVGSDVPALVISRTCGPVLMEGRGEVVSPLFVPDTPSRAARVLHMVLVNPGVFSSTAEVYSRCVPRVTSDGGILYNIRKALAGGDCGEIASALMNDLEAPAVALHPEIAAAKRALLEAGAAGAAMSGSGSTVFGLVPDEARGRETAALLSARGFRAWSVHTVCPVV